MRMKMWTKSLSPMCCYYSTGMENVTSNKENVGHHSISVQSSHPLPLWQVGLWFCNFVNNFRLSDACFSTLVMIVTLQHTLSSPFFSVIHWHLPWLLQDKSKFIYMMTNYLPQFSLLSGFHLWLEQKVGECEFWSLTGLQSQSWFLFLYAFHTHCANTRINSLV
jgi:hypothetical protein